MVANLVTTAPNPHMEFAFYEGTGLQTLLANRHHVFTEGSRGREGCVWEDSTEKRRAAN